MKLIDQEAAVACACEGCAAAIRALPPVEAAGMKEFEWALTDYANSVRYGDYYGDGKVSRQRVLDLYARAAAGKED